MHASRIPWTFLMILLAFGLVTSGCYTTTRGGGRGGSDDDDAGEDDDDAGEDDDDASSDDDDNTDDDDAGDDDDVQPDDDDVQPDDDDAQGGGCGTDEIEDCNDNCAPADWVGDGYCDDGSYEYGGNAIHLDCAEFNYDDGDCEGGDDDDDTVVADDDDFTPNPTTPSWVDDCTTGDNETMADAGGIQAVDGQTYSGQLCSNDVDVFMMWLPANTWASVEIDIDGSGSGSTDIDLYELETDSQAYQGSYTENSYERVAVYNETSSDRAHYFAVIPYNNAVADYDVIIQVSTYHEIMECDDAYASSPAEGGPCNYIMQHPRANGDYEGVWPEHPPVWSSVRREVAYLVRWAADEVMDEFPGTTPLALLDMSEKNGAVPGTLQGSLRHPAGTHVDGNDIDLAYYQNDGENNGEIVCPSNDGQFCTGPATLLDAERTAYFMAQLFLHPNVRVLGVDTEVANDVLDAADDLLASGQINSTQRNYFDTHMAYGSGWPYHHHHIHFSWDWESGWFSNLWPLFPQGCMEEASVVELPAKGPGMTIVEPFGK